MDLEEVYRIAEQCKNYEEFNGYICRLFHDSILTPDYKKETFKLVKNNGDLDDVMKCEYCGDVGRVEPTLQYPDGIKCYKCP